MPVITLPFGPLEANCHIVHNGRDAVVFDPSDETDLVLKKISENNLTLRAVALTHLHSDHCLGCADMTRATGLTVLVGMEDWVDRAMLLCKGMCFGMNLKPFEAEILAPGEADWGTAASSILPAIPPAVSATISRISVSSSPATFSSIVPWGAAICPAATTRT